jgi:hypothetical protein
LDAVLEVEGVFVLVLVMVPLRVLVGVCVIVTD